MTRPTHNFPVTPPHWGTRAKLTLPNARHLVVPAAGQDPDLELHGSVEFGAGARVRGDGLQPDDVLLSEARFRLDLLRRQA